jgi:hypothetical protein
MTDNTMATRKRQRDLQPRSIDYTVTQRLRNMNNTTNRGEPMYSGRVSSSSAASGNRPVTLVRLVSTPICSVVGSWFIYVICFYLFWYPTRFPYEMMFV